VRRSGGVLAGIIIAIGVTISLLLLPVGLAFTMPLIALLALLPVSFEEKSGVSRLYETLPMQRRHQIIARFFGMLLLIGAAAILANLIGELSLHLNWYRFSGSYEVVLSMQARNRTAGCFAASAFFISCLGVGYMMMMSFLFEKHRERGTILSLLVLFVLIIGSIALDRDFLGVLGLVEYFERKFETSLILFECVSYFWGTAATALFCGLTLLIAGRKEWKTA